MTSKTEKNLLPIFTVDTPPYAHFGGSIQKMSRNMFIGLIPVIILSIMTYGLLSLRVMMLAIGTAVLTEALCLYLADRENRIYDGTAMVAGLLFALLLPAGAPWWLVIIGSSLSIAIGKQAFGGLGANPLCTPLVGWAILTISWPTQMDPNAMVLGSNLIDPLLKLKYFGVQSLPEGINSALLLGEQLGGLGTGFIAAITLGGIYLLITRTIRPEATIAYFLGVLISGVIFWKIDPNTHISPELYFLTGSTVLMGFFFITDHASSPVSSIGLILFGLLAGILTVLMRIYGIYADGAPFAVLLANLCTPLLDIIRPRPWGKRS
ncbi:RnfABCDGE type electron transport complex subunit D [Desulfovibrio litoralis]|uniref:Electron transport complex protein RnfD n=1 Tax=Desulfovibrio litoralis DSM 11393 TaxID=1121455 RepID=A0A1M7SEF5_9BACT|nr:RnfABCDGE type electron transport complex subunit D [Desulfovibrio litoralis]SHN56840.1 electron transport complex protein RnfD [Desulfovibrio litoralis DSM 11393]